MLFLVLQWISCAQLHTPRHKASKPPAAPQAPKVPQPDRRLDQEKTTRLSIERQTAIKAACELFANATTPTIIDEVLDFARKATYFIATGLNLADKEQIDQAEEQLGAEITADNQAAETAYEQQQEENPPF